MYKFFKILIKKCLNYINKYLFINIIKKIHKLINLIIYLILIKKKFLIKIHSI